MNPVKWAIYSLFKEPNTIMPCNPKWFVYDLSIPSNMGSYFYLVDAQGMIRWQASAPIGNSEIEDFEPMQFLQAPLTGHKSWQIFPSAYSW